MSKRVPVPATVQKRITTKVNECLKIAGKHYGRNFSPIRVVYKKRGVVAGTANYLSRTVDINSVLLMENLEDMIDNTVPHEVAHILDKDVNGIQYTYTFGRRKRSSHGPTWKAMMRVLGVSPDRTHNYDVSRAKVKKNTSRESHVWTCRTCGTKMSLGPKRHMKMLSGMTKYWMRGCGRHAGYVYERSPSKVTPTSIIKPTPKKRTHTPSPVGGQSKQDLALQLFREYYGLTRSEMIALFIRELNMTKAGASTYYYNCKKRIS